MLGIAIMACQLPTVCLQDKRKMCTAKLYPWRQYTIGNSMCSKPGSPGFSTDLVKSHNLKHINFLENGVGGI